jgi:putative zinc finger/helix-turn-helix YgiT family protein
MEEEAVSCVMCGHALGAARSGTVPYRSLPGTMLVGVEVRACPNCGEEELSIPHMDALNSVLAHHVAGRSGRLTGPEIRFLRKHLGWSGADFARFFQTARSTVSRWESGKQNMDVRAEQLLRLSATRLEPITDYAEVERLLLLPAREATAARAVSARWQGEVWKVATGHLR